MNADEHKATRALSPVQLRGIALRVQGLDISEIAREVGRDRTTVSRWFTTDPLVIEALDRRVEDQYQTELQQHANLRTKALAVVEAALDGGDVKAALTVLPLTPKQQDHASAEKGISSSPINPFGAGAGHIGHDDVAAMLRELEVTSPWQIHVQRAAELLRAPAPVSDAEGILDRLLLLDDVASTVVRVLEEARGEGLPGFSSVGEHEREGLADDARRAIEEAWGIVGGDDDDDDDVGEPQWPGEDGADRAIELIGEALVAIVASLGGAPEALEAGAGADGAHLAARLIAARDAAGAVVDGDQPPTIESLVDAVMTLTNGFTDLVGALGEGASITVDAAWAEAQDGSEGGVGT